MIDALTPANRRSAIADCTFSADQACILGQLVGSGLTNTTGTSPHPGVRNLLGALQTDAPVTMAFIARENCRCGKQLASIIAASVATTRLPSQPCGEC
jgi:hypothetical protein